MLRGGADTDELDEFDAIGKLCALPELSPDKGINVTLACKGAGWRRPKSGDEVLLSYVARELGGGRQFERFDKKRLIRLGRGILPEGLERAIVLRFGKGAQGVVTLAPAYAFGPAVVPYRACPPPLKLSAACVPSTASALSVHSTLSRSSHVLTRPSRRVVRPWLIPTQASSTQ